MWGYEMRETPKETCLDCLYCKVSAKSTEKRRLCFCAKREKEVRHREGFWLTKKLCKDFESMDVPITHHSPRYLLLKGINFMDGLSWRRGNYI
jgi:hypothetical protein